MFKRFRKKQWLVCIHCGDKVERGQPPTRVQCPNNYCHTRIDPTDRTLGGINFK